MSNLILKLADFLESTDKFFESTIFSVVVISGVTSFVLGILYIM